MAVDPQIGVLKTWLNTGEVLFGDDLNGNFAAIKAAFNSHTHDPYLLGYLQYEGPFNYNVNVETVQDVDAANIKVTFTAPASGIVRVTLNGTVVCPGGGSTANYFWTLQDGGVEVTNARMFVFTEDTFNSGKAARMHNEVIITGLTPGQQYTWTWAHVVQAPAAVPTFTMIVNDTSPAIMSVYAV